MFGVDKDGLELLDADFGTISCDTEHCSADANNETESSVEDDRSDESDDGDVSTDGSGMCYCSS